MCHQSTHTHRLHVGHKTLAGGGYIHMKLLTILEINVIEHDEIIGLLRGFCVGDKIVVREPSVPKLREPDYQRIFDWLVQQPYVELTDIMYPCPQYGIGVVSVDYTGEQFWLWEDEIAHYYEDRND